MARVAPRVGQKANPRRAVGSTAEPDYGKVVSICTGAAQKELMTPALNPLIKVINLVSVIAASLMVVPVAGGKFRELGLTPVTIAVSAIGLLIVIMTLWFSRRAESFGREDESERYT